MAPPAIFDQGPYDPAPYDPTAPATWPQYQPPSVAYQPGMWWTSTGVGTIDGQPVAPGDYLFAIYKPRYYGELSYGDGDYGGHPSGDWDPTNVRFDVWDSTLPPWQQPPFPNAGCPFDAERFPGWRIVIDALYQDTPTRTYGQLTYGDDTYGDTDTPTMRWADITRPSYQVNIVAGTTDGAPTVPVVEVSIQMHDDAGVWVDISEPAYYFLPFVGDPIRVGFLDPGLAYHPVAVGSIETILDEHDTLPRFVNIQAFGNDRDLSNDILGWQRPAESTSSRFAALMAAGGWRFGGGNLVYPPGDAALHADVQAHDITVRAELDRTVMSAGWFFDTDPSGGPRLREWPHHPTGPTLAVVDCAEDGDTGVLSPRITFGANEAQILNVATISNAADPTVIVTAAEDLSIARFGRRSKAMGFPHTGLAFADGNDAAALVVRYSNRWAFIVRQVDAVEADTDVDPAWLAVLVDIDTGRAVHVERREIHPMALDGVIVGYEHQILPKQFTSTLDVATTTGTF